MRALLMMGLMLAGSTAQAEGLLYVSSTPSGAQIAVDGKLTSHRTPVQLLLTGGAHKISVMKAGHEVAHQRVKVLDSKVVRVQLVLTPAGQEPTQAPRTPKSRRRPLVVGSVTLITDVIGASISLDGKPTGLKTPITVRIPVGRHTLRLTHGTAYVDQTVTIHKGNNAQIQVNLRPHTARPASTAAPAAPQNTAASDPTYPARLKACLRQCKHKAFEAPCNTQQEQCIAQCPGKVGARVVNPGYYHPCADTCKSRRQFCLDTAVSRCKNDCAANPPR